MPASGDERIERGLLVVSRLLAAAQQGQQCRGGAHPQLRVVAEVTHPTAVDGVDGLEVRCSHGRQLLEPGCQRVNRLDRRAAASGPEVKPEKGEAVLGAANPRLERVELEPERLDGSPQLVLRGSHVGLSRGEHDQVVAVAQIARPSLAQQPVDVGKVEVAQQRGERRPLRDPHDEVAYLVTVEDPAVDQAVEETEAAVVDERGQHLVQALGADVVVEALDICP